MGKEEERIKAKEKEIMRELRDDPTGQALEKLREELDELLAGREAKEAGLLEKLARLLRRKRR